TAISRGLPSWQIVRVRRGLKGAPGGASDIAPHCSRQTAPPMCNCGLTPARRPMDSKELARRFKTAGRAGAPEIQAFVAEVGVLPRDDVERLLGVLTTKGLPGDSRDQRNRCFIFGKIAERTVDKALFLPYIRSLKTADAQIAATVAPLIAKVNNTEGHA